MTELQIINAVVSLGVGGVLAIVIFLMYRRDSVRCLKKDIGGHIR